MRRFPVANKDVLRSTRIYLPGSNCWLRLRACRTCLVRYLLSAKSNEQRIGRARDCLIIILSSGRFSSSVLIPTTSSLRFVVERSRSNMVKGIPSLPLSNILIVDSDDRVFEAVRCVEICYSPK